jgi:Alternative complex III, ActD subunit
MAAQELHGLLAEFDSPDAVVAAARHCREQGYRRLDAYSPFPVAALAEALGFRERRLPWIALAGGLAGGIGGFLMQWSTNAVDYPLNVGGRPLDAWPAFAVISFYLLSLGTILAVVFGMLALCRLPRLHHPVFAAARFRRVTNDRFFLAIERDDPRFDPAATRALLERQGALAVEELPA